MSSTINYGTGFFIWNFSVPTTGASIVLNQDVNSVVIQNRTAVDIQLRTSGGASDYFTIKSGTNLPLGVNTTTKTPIHLTSTSGTVNIEIIGYLE